MGVTFGNFLTSLDSSAEDEAFFLDFSLPFDFLTGDGSDSTGDGSTCSMLALSTRAFLDFLTGVDAMSCWLAFPFSTSPCLRFLAAFFGVPDLAFSGGAWVISTSSSSDASIPIVPAPPLATPNG